MKSVPFFVELLGLDSDSQHALQISDSVQVIWFLLPPLLLPHFPLLVIELCPGLKLIVQSCNLVYFLNQYSKFLLAMSKLIFIFVLLVMSLANPAFFYFLLQLFVLVS